MAGKWGSGPPPPSTLPLISASLATSAGKIRTVFSGLHLLTLPCVHVRSSPALGGLHRPGENLRTDSIIGFAVRHRWSPATGEGQHPPRAQSPPRDHTRTPERVQRAHVLWDVLGAPFLSLSRLGVTFSRIGLVRPVHSLRPWQENGLWIRKGQSQLSSQDASCHPRGHAVPMAGVAPSWPRDG